SITLVRFALNANVIGTFDNFTDFQNALNIPADDRGVNTFGTNYTAALNATMGPGGYDPQSGWINQVFFISDGEPRNDVQGSFPGSVTHSLLPATQTAWNDFVVDNDITVTTIGVTDAIDEQRLQDVD